MTTKKLLLHYRDTVRGSMKNVQNVTWEANASNLDRNTVSYKMGDKILKTSAE